MDGDNSGAIDFSEFLLLAIPGMSKANSSKKPRGFTVNPFRNAMFEDADGTGGEVGAREAEIPEQCFAAGEEVAVDEAKSKGLFAELRIRFKKNVHDNPGRSESARDGNIVLPLALKRDCWVERVYPFNDKAPAQGSGGAGGVSYSNLCINMNHWILNPPSSNDLTCTNPKPFQYAALNSSTFRQIP